jgi:tRNA threonylcarbamoyladenosine biosynthesis protein TsaE
MPQAAVRECKFVLPDADATDAFGARLAAAIDASRAAGAFTGLTVHLSGDLGAGKTALVRAVLRALGHGARVRSPTYTLVEPYALARTAGCDAPLQVYHFDLYRFDDPREWEGAGFREYLDAGALCLIEWPQKAAGLAPPDLTLDFEVTGHGRVLVARAWTAAGKQSLDLVESC